jgi:hypothetical protein
MATTLLLKAALIQVSDYMHLGASGCNLQTEPPDTFLEENHSMTISSKFSSY